MSFEINRSLKGDFVIDSQTLADAVEESWFLANKSKDRILAEFECKQPECVESQRMLEGAKYVAALAATERDNPNEALSSLYVGALLGVYVAELCAGNHGISCPDMYAQWHETSGWRDQMRHYSGAAVVECGAEAFVELPAPLSSLAIKFAIDSRLASSVDDVSIGYGLTLGPLYKELNSMYSQRLLEHGIDAEVRQLLGE